MHFQLRGHSYDTYLTETAVGRVGRNVRLHFAQLKTTFLVALKTT